MKTWFLFILCIFFLVTPAIGDLCPSLDFSIPTSGVCERNKACNISQNKTIKGAVVPGTLQVFCLDPGFDIDYLAVTTTVDPGCGYTSTTVTPDDGTQMSSSDNVNNIEMDRLNGVVKRPIKVAVLGLARPDSFHLPIQPPEPVDLGGPTCDPPPSSVTP
jgi:hypothetical protein